MRGIGECVCGRQLYCKPIWSQCVGERSEKWKFPCYYALYNKNYVLFFGVSVDDNDDGSMNFPFTTNWAVGDHTRLTPFLQQPLS